MPTAYLAFVERCAQGVDLQDQLLELLPLADGLLSVEAMLLGPPSALTTVHSTPAVRHREVQAWVAGRSAMRTAAVLHGVSCHEGCPPPELTVPTTACPPAPTLTC
jgi:hypothetical protein